MAVSFRTVGTWAELTADGAVAIPATPQAGDRMYLFARWKDFSVTATVANWTELTEFADGSTGSGNGTGSVKVGCWYRDWQSGDGNPTIDFSANPNSASVVIIVMAKASTESWLTPVAVTAAMTNWTTSSQIVAASSTASVLSGGVVMGLIGIRDDTATMTRPTSGIDDSAGAVTWNGDYVESPATHHSTTTGDDGAADLGYRLVTTGATATLRMTGTISAAETGAGLWVVQGIEFNLSITDAAHAQTVENVALTQVHAITVGNALHSQSADNAVLTQVHEIAAQNSSHAHAAESPSLTQLHELAAQDANHAHTVDSPAITQEHVLDVEDAAHSQTSESPTFEVIHNLDIQDASHTQTAAPLTLTQEHILVVANAAHAHTAQSPVVKTISIIYVDPGGDATQAIGHFSKEPAGSTGDVSFDTATQVVGVGSYKFDSGGSGLPAYLFVPGVLGAARRVGAYFWYTSVPDVVQSATKFASGAGDPYSGGGFTDPVQMGAADDTYGTATPDQNDGQGTVFSSLGLTSGTGLTPDVQMVSVKIIYERKYDTILSEGISRVKWRVNGEEGPDHDNTDMPLTDTVVEVDVTNDMFWEQQHLTDESFEIIAEARRGNTVIPHTQSWDYVKVEVVYRPLATIMAAYDGEDIAFSLALLPKVDHAVVRFVEGIGPDGSRFTYDGITRLETGDKNRISFAYVSNGSNDLDIKVFVNGIEELSIEAIKTNGWDGASADLYYGWIHTPGVDHVSWIDQLYIDDGDDLTDCGNTLSTHKGPASTNENEWNTTGGTGAVGERPLSETNFRQETRASQFRQTNTLQTVDAGDIDLTGETLVGYMGWAWAKKGAGSLDGIQLVLNGLDLESGSAATLITTTPSLVRSSVKTSSYPSNAAGIGMASNNETADTFMYECGVVVGYVGPSNPDILLERQVVTNTTLDTIIDDLRSDPPDTYELGYIVDDFDGLVTMRIYTIAFEGAEVVAYPTEFSSGGHARFPLPAGIEVRIDVEVIGSTNVTIYRRLNTSG